MTVDARDRSPFGVIYRDDLAHPVMQALPDRAFRLYVALTTYAKAGRGSVWPKRATIAELLGWSVRTVRRALAELVERGIVERVYDLDRNGVPISEVVLLPVCNWRPNAALFEDTPLTPADRGEADTPCPGGADTTCPTEQTTVEQNTGNTDPPNPPAGGLMPMRVASEHGEQPRLPRPVERLLVEVLQQNRQEGWTPDAVELEDPGRGVVQLLVDTARRSHVAPASWSSLHVRQLRRQVAAWLPWLWSETVETDAEEDLADAVEEDGWQVLELHDPLLDGQNWCEQWHPFVEVVAEYSAPVAVALRLSRVTPAGQCLVLEVPMVCAPLLDGAVIDLLHLLREERPIS